MDYAFQPVLTDANLDVLDAKTVAKEDVQLNAAVLVVVDAKGDVLWPANQTVL